MNKGRFIAIEGPDGAGTTTQARHLEKYLKIRGIEIHPTREPSDGPIGRLIREALRHSIDAKFSPLTMQLLFSTDRSEHLESEIEPKLEKGIWVLTERYFFSTLAYGGVALAGMENGAECMQALKDVNNLYRVPDLTFILDLDIDICIKRIEKRGNQKELYERAEFLRKVRSNYGTLRTEYHNVAVIDGSKSEEEVHKMITQRVEPLIARYLTTADDED